MVVGITIPHACAISDMAVTAASSVSVGIDYDWKGH